jgi:SAM-dependent MidA family methyltransferase
MTLEKIIKDLLKEKQFLSISQFINIALYHPEYGYYQKKNPFGMGGDFVTSPQISSLFNEMFSWFFVYHFKKHYKEGMKVYFIELGSGNGFFIRDFLTIAAAAGISPHLEVILVEISDKLQEEQRKVLSPFLGTIKINWEKDTLEALNSISDDQNNLILLFSNEFFDAFPINQFLKIAGKWHEICVIPSEDGEKLEMGYTHFDYSTAIKNHLNLIEVEEEVTKEGDIIEVSNDQIEIFTSIARKLKTNKGVAVTVDYGYNKTEFISTLQSLKNHKQNEVLENMGEADITSLVNFELFFYIAKAEGITAYPPLTQKEFLESIGIREKLKMYLDKEPNEAKRYALETSTARVIGADQMGELFKVLIMENL